MEIILLFIFICVFLTISTVNLQNKHKYKETGLIHGWIQHCDYSGDEYREIEKETFADLLTNHDWKSEIERQQEAEAKGLDNCAPGAGITLNNQKILHICPGDGGRYLVYFHRGELKRNLLQVLRFNQESFSCPSMDRQGLDECVDLFFDKGFDQLAEFITEQNI